MPPGPSERKSNSRPRLNLYDGVILRIFMRRKKHLNYPLQFSTDVERAVVLCSAAEGGAVYALGPRNFRACESEGGITELGPPQARGYSK